MHGAGQNSDGRTTIDEQRWRLDQQIGTRIAEGNLDLLVFLWDPFAPMPHDPDVKALLRLAALWNVPVASNAASADFLFHSKLISEEVEVAVPDANDWVSTRA